MKKMIALLAVALLAPSVALAKGNPGHGNGNTNGHGNKANPKVLYILKGTLSGYTAYDSSTSTNGSVTIAVTRANRHGKALVGQTLTIPVGANTKLTFGNGTTTISDGDKGIVKIKAAKKTPAADLATTLESSAAFQVIDQGASGSATGEGSTNGHGNRANPTVLYVLKGTFSGYAGYDSSTSTNGSITIAVTRANRHGKALAGESLTFPIGSTTRISLRGGVTTVADGDKGIVKIRAAQRIAVADLATTLEAVNVRQVVDQGAPSSG